MGQSYLNARVDANALARALDRAERAAHRGHARSAARAIDRFTQSLETGRGRRDRAWTVLASTLAVVAMLGGAASAHRRPTADLGPAAAIRVADVALRAADRIDDPVAISQIVEGVQETITSLTSHAATDERVATQLQSLAHKQAGLLAQTAGVSRELVERARSIVRILDAVVEPVAEPTEPVAEPTADAVP